MSECWWHILDILSFWMMLVSGVVLAFILSAIAYLSQR